VTAGEGDATGRDSSPGRKEEESLAERLRREPRLPLSEALSLFRLALQSIRELHQSGAVHRDLRPENIILGADGSVKVAPFAPANLMEPDPDICRRERLSSSPSFMSPEAALGKRLDQRSDIYSLGAILYRMVTGVAPFEAESARDGVSKVVTEPLKPARALLQSIPTSISEYISLLMRKEPRMRIGSAGEALSLLESLEKAEAKRALEKPGPRRLVPALLLALLGAFTWALPPGSWNDGTRRAAEAKSHAPEVKAHAGSLPTQGGRMDVHATSE
jgi:serine/threonine-protein kinase